jgi:hypothetical protein
VAIGHTDLFVYAEDKHAVADEAIVWLQSRADT